MMFAHDVSTPQRERPKLDRFAIRAMDVIIALVSLVFFAPLMVIIAIISFVSDPGPIFFSQLRIGRHGRMFHCYKFRTMAVNAQERLDEVLRTDPVARAEWARDHKLRNDPRIVGIGRFLRKSSLDELPQIFNVLKGDMSIVGPRPIVMAEADRYGRYLRHYCAVRPGITGLWQISGRNDVTYRRRVAFDVAYSKHVSPLIYLKVMILTVPSVVMARGSY